MEMECAWQNYIIVDQIAPLGDPYHLVAGYRLSATKKLNGAENMGRSWSNKAVIWVNYPK